MKITFANGAELPILGVNGRVVTHNGVQRDSLLIMMSPDAVTLEQALAAFSEDACTQLWLTDTDSTYVHEHYTIRLEAGQGYKDFALTGGVNANDQSQCVYVRMARATLAERQLQSQQETIDALLIASLEGGV